MVLDGAHREKGVHEHTWRPDVGIKHAVDKIGVIGSHHLRQSSQELQQVSVTAATAEYAYSNLVWQYQAGWVGDQCSMSCSLGEYACIHMCGWRFMWCSCRCVPDVQVKDWKSSVSDGILKLSYFILMHAFDSTPHDMDFGIFSDILIPYSRYRYRENPNDRWKILNWSQHCDVNKRLALLSFLHSSDCILLSCGMRMRVSGTSRC